jgi:hypothetical protein
MSHNINLPYLQLLVAAMRGQPLAEHLVQLVSKGKLTVATMAASVEKCLHECLFPLLRSGHLQGKHVGDNYKSALLGREKVTKALRKRLAKGQTLGLYVVGDATNLVMPNYAINSLGAVPKRGSNSLRPVDDVIANDEITAPPLGMPSIAWLRATATHLCY